MRSFTAIHRLLCLAIAALLAVPLAAAQSVTILHSFDNNGQDGYHPWSGLTLDAQGNLYGTTTRGGTHDVGTVYKLSANSDGSWTEAVLHSFAYDGIDGYSPDDSVVLDSVGNIYGTASLGGTGACTNPIGVVIGCGIVFKLVPSSNGGYTEKILYNFKFNEVDGYNPTGGVILDSAGNLYGTTKNGGSSHSGTVYELSNTGGHWIETLLWTFNETDGAEPWAGLILDSAGNLYGTTGAGGAYKFGTAFELSPLAGGTWTETVLHSFNDTATDAAYPEAPLFLDSAGNLYGTGALGGLAGGGAVFELSPTTGGSWTETILYLFAGKDEGYDIWSPVILDPSGNVYGTTSCGGTGGCDQLGGNIGCGVIYELSPSSNGSWTETVPYNFDFTSNNNPEGPEGSGLIPDGKGHYYGTTYAGGEYTHGTVFEFTP